MLELDLKARTTPAYQEGLGRARAARLQMGTKGSIAVTSEGGGEGGGGGSKARQGGGHLNEGRRGVTANQRA